MSADQNVRARRRAHERRRPAETIYALLDTNALIPPRLSDMLFDCAGQGLFLPRWTRHIEQEFLQNWKDVVSRVPRRIRTDRKQQGTPLPDDAVNGAMKRLSCFRAAVGREWEIIGYDNPHVLARVPPAVDRSDIPHVAACLVLLDSLSEERAPFRVFLVSRNVKDLSIDALQSLGIEAQTPGDFLDFLSGIDTTLVETALRATVSDLNSYRQDDLIKALRLHGAFRTAELLMGSWGIQSLD